MIFNFIGLKTLKSAEIRWIMQNALISRFRKQYEAAHFYLVTITGRGICICAG